MATTNTKEEAIATRDRIGRIYGFTGTYGTTSTDPDPWEGNDDGLEDLHEDYPGQHITGPDIVE